jgi:undecaprenyl diphosphate synthase
MQHLACIMDGNRRWAREHKLEAFLGHKSGSRAIERVIEFCLKQKIRYLSLFTFSIENFKRSQEECSYLFTLLSSQIEKNIPKFIANDIRVSFIGDRSLFPEVVRPSIEQVETQTSHCNTLSINFLFCYGARQEIVGSLKTLIRKIQAGLISEDQISEETISAHLWTAGVPEPDLVVRTGGAVRLSNFLLYQAAYSEFYFLDCYWPDINETHLQSALEYFHASKRNFGS